MTLLFRAVWQDERESLVDAAEGAFVTWLAGRGFGDHLPDEGSVSGLGACGPVEVRVRRAVHGGLEAAQFELAELPCPGLRTVIRLTVLGGDPGRRWLWVDLAEIASGEEGKDRSDRAPMASPGLVSDLITSGVDARVDHVRISCTPQRLKPQGLAGLVRNGGRSLPLVVFSEDPAGFTPTLIRADEAARSLAGAVQVVVLTASDSAQFTDLMGDLGVGDGDARIYLPNFGPGGLRPDRHRALRRGQIAGDPERAVRILSSMLAATVTSRRPPPGYEDVRRELRLGRSRSDAQLLALAEDEISRLTAERDALRDELRRVEEDHLDTQSDLEEAVVEASRLGNRLQVILSAGLRPVSADAGSPEPAEQVADLACEARSIAEALELARRLLTAVVVPAGVERDVEILDSHVNSAAWGELVWRGLRALHCYATTGFDGNFRQWCMHSGHVWAWPASEKKLAMRESETVETNARLAAQRRFPVDTSVDASGQILMWAHLKIAEGGGPLAPRVYFHDDTRGVTGRVHVGFVGPHRYTENTRTN